MRGGPGPLEAAAPKKDIINCHSDTVNLFAPANLIRDVSVLLYRKQ